MSESASRVRKKADTCAFASITHPIDEALKMDSFMRDNDFHVAGEAIDDKFTDIERLCAHFFKLKVTFHKPVGKEGAHLGNPDPYSMTWSTNDDGLFQRKCSSRKYSIYFLNTVSCDATRETKSSGPKWDSILKDIGRKIIAQQYHSCRYLFSTRGLEHIYKELSNNFPNFWMPCLGCLKNVELDIAFDGYAPKFCKPRLVAFPLKEPVNRALDDGVSGGHRLAINTHKGVYLQMTLPFGIKSAPGYFQEIMAKVTSGLEGVAVYLDDILVTGVDDTSHITNLATFLK
ncbi:hypothetical protein RF11_09861 [Thelohanellus kitauei]|uniref:Reverse transcriptase domain-containing protein n=1 Tax=Thelohanellus kitauei TaxID=669202 RepID=A0A0C2NEZ2_THEKT|nr:hypothetical protein RF11_09861 [Thelohanellus kitauei]